MLGVLLALAPLSISAVPDEPAPLPADAAAYRAEAAAVGRDADAHVRLALWCEGHGLDAERLKHLAIALMTDPSHATARGLMGMVRDGSAWRKPDAVAERVKSDAELSAALAEYETRRAAMEDDADGHWRLALWCAEHGLDAESKAHLTAVVRLDPGRDVAWKRLGFRKHDGRWMTDEQIVAVAAERKAQKKADERWTPLLERWKDQLSDRDGAVRDEARRLLSEVDDPRAVPTVVRVFGHGSAASQAMAVQVLGQIDAPGASRILALLAVGGKSAEVRRAATETLTWRDPRPFLDGLVAMVRRPVRFEVRPVGGPGSPGVLFVEAQEFNLQRIYDAPTAPFVPLQRGDSIVFDQRGLPVIVRETAQTRFSTSMGQGFSAQGFGGIGTGVQSPLGAGPAAADTRAQLGALTAHAFGAGGDRAADLLAAYATNPGLGNAWSLTDPLMSGNVWSQASSVMAASLMAKPGNPATRFTFDVGQFSGIRVGQMELEARAAAVSSQRQLEMDVAALERLNGSIREANGPALDVLRSLSGEDFGDDTDAWTKWAADAQGWNAYTRTPPPRPVIVQEVAPAYIPQPVPVQALGPALVGFSRTSCFAAGTPVRTLTGPRPIEELAIGDRVLTQDGETGALSFQPILTVYHNPPARTLRVALDDGSTPIVATPIHRFWRVGEGWVMARNLKAGDVVRTLGGRAVVKSVEEAPVQPVFNLQVAAGSSYFAGDGGALVHDNSIVLRADRPFDSGAED